jgi:hypothetical protein
MWFESAKDIRDMLIWRERLKDSGSMSHICWILMQMDRMDCDLVKEDEVNDLKGYLYQLGDIYRDGGEFSHDGFFLETNYERLEFDMKDLIWGVFTEQEFGDFYGESVKKANAIYRGFERNNILPAISEMQFEDLDADQSEVVHMVLDALGGLVRIVEMHNRGEHEVAKKLYDDYLSDMEEHDPAPDSVDID